MMLQKAEPVAIARHAETADIVALVAERITVGKLTQRSMSIPGLLILLLLLLAVQAVFLREAFSANGYIQTTGGSPSEAFSANGYIQTTGGSPSEAFGSSQGGAQLQLAASRTAYYVA